MNLESAQERLETILQDVTRINQELKALHTILTTNPPSNIDSIQDIIDTCHRYKADLKELDDERAYWLAILSGTATLG